MRAKAFTLLETVIALTILFLAIFAILRLEEGTGSFFASVEASERAWMSSSVVAAFDGNLSLKKELHSIDLLRQSGIETPEALKNSLPQKVRIIPYSTSRAVLDQNLTLQVYSVKILTDGHTAILYGIAQ